MTPKKVIIKARYNVIMMSYDLIVKFSVDKLGITDLGKNIETCHKQVH